MDSQQTDILIIGAGLTGLTTGFWLTRAGKDIHILEKLIVSEDKSIRSAKMILSTKAAPIQVSSPTPKSPNFSKPSPQPVHWRLPRRIQTSADLERRSVPGPPVRTVQCSHDSSVYAWRQVPYPRRTVSGKREQSG